MKLKCYVAGSYESKTNVRMVQRIIEQGANFNITYDWTDHECEDLSSPDYKDDEKRKQYLRDAGTADRKGVEGADVIVAVFDRADYPYRGTFTEIGMALGLKTPIIALILNDKIIEDVKKPTTKTNENIDCEGDVILDERNCVIAGYARNPFFWDHQIFHIRNPGVLNLTLQNLFPPVIGIAGFAHSGKDTCADIIHEKYQFYVRSAFANKVRENVQKHNPWINLKGSPGYENIDKFIQYNDAIKMYGGYESAKKLVPEVRKTLISYGHGNRDTFGEGIWSNQVLSPEKFNSYKDFLCISDTRYERHEADMIRYYRGLVLMVVRPGVGGSIPEELESIPKIKFHFAIINDGSVKDLRNKVLSLMCTKNQLLERGRLMGSEIFHVLDDLKNLPADEPPPYWVI